LNNKRTIKTNLRGLHKKLILDCRQPSSFTQRYYSWMQ